MGRPQSFAPSGRQNSVQVPRSTHQMPGSPQNWGLPGIWCGRRDLNPYGKSTRPSNVRVCQFRHSRVTNDIIHDEGRFVNPFCKKIFALFTGLARAFYALCGRAGKPGFKKRGRVAVFGGSAPLKDAFRGRFGLPENDAGITRSVRRPGVLPGAFRCRESICSGTLCSSV